MGAALTLIEIDAHNPANEPDDLELNNQFPMQQQFMQQQFKSIFKDQENTILAKTLQEPGELRKIMNKQHNQLKYTIRIPPVTKNKSNK